MPNDDEKTKPLYNLDDLNNNNQIFEMEKPKEVEKEEILNNNEFMEAPKKEKKENKLKKWWKKRTKKQRILLIVAAILLIILLAIGIFFLVKSITKKPVEEPKVDVIIQEENYRYENGHLIFLNSNKEEIGSYTCQNQNENLCFVAYYSGEDQFDIEQKLYVDNTKILKRSSIENNNYVFINDNPKESSTEVLLYNIKENKEEDKYQLVKDVVNKENLVIIKNNDNKYGIIDLSKEKVETAVDFSYDYLASISNFSGYISIQSNRPILIDENGKNTSKAFLGEIKNVKNNYVKVLMDSGKYEVYDFNGSKVFNESYDYVELYDDYAALINDSKLYLKFYDNAKLIEEPITLNNKEYVKKSIYDENNKLVETKESFYIEENNDIITIHVSKDSTETSTTINKLEGKISKNLKNINYFDGKLYIYLDAAKTELLGIYTCANKNTIKSDTTTLDNCNIAKDTSFEDNDYEKPGTPGVIPIFNERFAFINDNPSLVNDDNKTIVLYDLKKSTSLGKYEEINTYSYTGSNEISFATVADLQVVAKNKSDKYGVIKIGLSEVKGHINFNYSAIESLRDCYVAKDVNGYQLLRKTDGASLTSNISYKIRNYNDTAKYVTVINNGKYFIYDYQNKQLSLKENGYTYIELYDYFYATVNSNNVLNIYTYQNPNRNEIEGSNITLNLDNYYKNGTLAFKISTNGLNYEIFKGLSNNTYELVYTGTIELEED